MLHEINTDDLFPSPCPPPARPALSRTCSKAHSHTRITLCRLLSQPAYGCRQYIHTKTGQELPKENMDAGLEELVAAYKTELGLSDKEAAQLEHLQVSLASPRLALTCQVV